MPPVPPAAPRDWPPARPVIFHHDAPARACGARGDRREGAPASSDDREHVTERPARARDPVGCAATCGWATTRRCSRPRRGAPAASGARSSPSSSGSRGSAAPGRPAARRAGGSGTRSRAWTPSCDGSAPGCWSSAATRWRSSPRSRGTSQRPPSSGRQGLDPDETGRRRRARVRACRDRRRGRRRPAGQPARRSARDTHAGRPAVHRLHARSGAPASRPARPTGRFRRPPHCRPRRARRRAPDSLASRAKPAPPWSAGLAELWRPGERGAHMRLESFLAGPLADYAADRDRPDLDGSSRLSPHLHWGELSARQVWHAVEGALAEAGLDLEAAVGPPSWDEEQAPGLRRSAGAFLRQLGWREFAHQLLAAFPRTPAEPLRDALRGLPLARRPGRARGLAARPHRLPHRRRRHAPALDDRLDAQPRTDARRVVPRQGPAAAVAGRRRLVLGHAGRRRPRQQHARLAVGRRLRRGRGAVLPRVQPGDAGPAVRPRRRLRAPLGAGARGSGRPAPARPLAGAGRTCSPAPASRSARRIRRRSSITARPACGRSPPTSASGPAEPARRPALRAAPGPPPRLPRRSVQRDDLRHRPPSGPTATSASVRGLPKRPLPAAPGLRNSVFSRHSTAALWLWPLTTRSKPSATGSWRPMRLLPMWHTRMRRPSDSTSASHGRSSSQNGQVGVADHRRDGRELPQAGEDVDRADVAGVDDAFRAGEQTRPAPRRSSCACR